VITRRHIVVASLSALVLARVSFAQPQRSAPRIGFLISETLPASSSRIEALRTGLRDYGYIDGKNITIELRSADGNYDRLPSLAAELVKLKVDVIVAFGTKAVTAAKDATTTIPIVDPVMGDPVGAGLGASLSRPGGNITGSAQFSSELAAKRLEFLREAVPRIARVAALLNPANTGTAMQLQAMQSAARALSVELQVVEATNASEIERGFESMTQKRADAVIVATDTLFQTNASGTAQLAATHRLPSCGARAFALAGGMIGYGVNVSEMFRHAAYFIDRILKGAKPGDLPIERATRFELVINLKTAKALGLTIPQSVLLRANEVIQ
jgi:putative ABC transport system substrate-binding protein